MQPYKHIFTLKKICPELAAVVLWIYCWTRNSCPPMQQIQEYDRMKITMLNVDLHKDDEEKKLYTTSRWYWHFHLSGIVWLCALTLYMSISCHVPASFFLVVQVGFGFSENRRSNYWDMQHRAHGVKSIKSQSKSPIWIQNSSLTPHSSMALYNGLHLLLALPLVSRLSTM